MDGISVVTGGLKRAGGAFADGVVTAGLVTAFGYSIPQAINTARRLILLFARRLK